MRPKLRTFSCDSTLSGADKEDVTHGSVTGRRQSLPAANVDRAALRASATERNVGRVASTTAPRSHSMSWCSHETAR